MLKRYLLLFLDSKCAFMNCFKITKINKYHINNLGDNSQLYNVNALQYFVKTLLFLEGWGKGVPENIG